MEGRDKLKKKWVGKQVFSVVKMGTNTITTAKKEIILSETVLVPAKEQDRIAVFLACLL